MFSHNYSTGLSDKPLYILHESPVSLPGKTPLRNGRGCVIPPGLCNLLMLTLGRKSVASRSFFQPLGVLFSGIT